MELELMINETIDLIEK